jgi:hypothetical protein
VAADDELEAQLAELERQRGEGQISDLTFTVQRNLLLTLREQSERRRTVALRIAPPSPPAAIPPPRGRRGRGRKARPRARSAPAQTPPRSPEPSAPPLEPSAQPSPHSARPAQAPAPPPEPSVPTAPPGGSPRRSRRILGGLLAAALVVALGALVLMLHHSPGKPAGQGPSAAGALTGGSTPAGSSSGPTVVTIDESQALPGGGTASVFIYTDHFTPASLGTPISSGDFLAAVEVQVCAGGAPTTVSPSDFLLVEPDRSQATPTAGPGEGFQPGLQNQELMPGQCASGWVNYAVAVTPTAIEEAPAHLSWAIP